MNPILIHKGDDTIFADVTKFLTFNIATALDLNGFKAQFTLAYIEKTIDDISSKSFDVVLTASDTAKLWLGEQKGKLILFDSAGNRKTISTTIPFLITNDVVENQYQEIDLDIPKSSGVDIKLRVGGGQSGAVTSVNGMTGDVIIGVPSIEGLATKEELDTKQDKGDYALIENIPTLVSQLDNDSGYTTQLDVMQAIASIPQFKLKIVDSLSRDDAEPMVLYLVSKGGSAPDVYDEYIWLEETGNFEFLGTTAVDLTGYVKNTDYATASTAGLIRGYNANGFGFVTDSGYPYCESKSLASYNASDGNLFIGKGTLESIKYSYVRDGIAKNTYSLSDSEKEKVRNWIGAGVPTVFETMPDIYASEGKTYQYVGETTEEFTSGYFYKSVSQGISYITSDSNLTFDFDLFWSELASAGITLETLQMTEFDKERGGFSIIGTVEFETNYRVQDINGIPLDVLLTQSIRSTSEYVGMSNRWYYKPAETFAWERVDVQPEQDLTEYVKNTDYATSSVGGVIKIANNYYYGLALNSSHQLYIVKAPDNQVIEKENMYRPIVPANLDLAVKTGVTTNTIELTDDEKTSAKQWLGYATQSDINTAIANLPQFKISIFDTLPETGETKVLYLVPKDSEAPDVYNEYIWIEDTSSFEFLGSTAVDLTDYVKNTDYATTSKVGLLKASQTYSFNVKAENGNAQCMVVSLDNYPSKDNTAFICKGTLDNVLTQYSKTVSMTEADYEALETKDPNTLYLIEEE